MTQSQKCFFLFPEIAAFKTQCLPIIYTNSFTQPLAVLWGKVGAAFVVSSFNTTWWWWCWGRCLHKLPHWISQSSLPGQIRSVFRLAHKTILSFHCLYRGINTHEQRLSLAELLQTLALTSTYNQGRAQQWSNALIFLVSCEYEVKRQKAFG